MHKPSTHSNRLSASYWWLTVGVLLLMFALALPSLAREGPTFDEQGFLVRGLGYVRNENRQMRVGHPLGLNALNAALLWRDPSVTLPVDDPSWQTTAFHRPAELFLWEIGNDVAHVLFLGRLPTLWLALVLVSVCARWAHELVAPHGREKAAGAALLAALLVGLDPNVLAHARLATTDFGLTAGAIIATYTLWRFLRKPTWRRAAMAGVGLGLLFNTKFTAGLFVPLLALVIAIALVQRWRQRGAFPLDMLLPLVTVYPLAGVLTLWAAYGFDVGTLPESLPAFSGWLGGRTLPLAHYIEQLSDLGGRMEKATPAFLRGRYSDSGWWFYFPVAFVLKTPLPTLVLLAVAAVSGGWRRGGIRPKPHHLLNLSALVIPAVGFFTFAMTTDINIGYRHILTTVPFVAVFAAYQLGRRSALPRGASWAGVLLVAWLLFDTLRVAPHFLAYFNPLAGGPDGGWRSLVDSNLDWGQDLPRLAPWMAENGVDEVWLSYFGEARPDYYGIRYRGLPSFPPRLMQPDAFTLYPPSPAPGVYAISATNLQGVMFDDHDLLAFFREREPIDKLGYSIFLYEVAADGPPVDLLLGGVSVRDVAPDDYAALGSNDVTLHWFDPTESVLIRPNATLLLAADADLPEAAATIVAANGTPQPSSGPYASWRFAPAAPTLPANMLPYDSSLTLGAGRIGLTAATELDANLSLTTVWQQTGDPQPLKLFVHLLDQNDAIVAQWDGLGAVWHGWRAGDWLVQQHALTGAAPLSPGRYRLAIGAYDPQSGARWQGADGDAIDLGEVVIP